MPYNKIADRKGHQGWMKREGPYFIFPGGGTMFPDGAIQYIKKLKQYIPIGGGVLRTALDMGCGVGIQFSFIFTLLELIKFYHSQTTPPFSTLGCQFWWLPTC